MARPLDVSARVSPPQLPRSKAFEPLNEAAAQMLADPQRNPEPVIKLLGHDVEEFSEPLSEIVGPSPFAQYSSGISEISGVAYRDGTEVTVQRYLDGRERGESVTVNSPSSVEGVLWAHVSAAPKAVDQISLSGSQGVDEKGHFGFADAIQVTGRSDGSARVLAKGMFSPLPGGHQAEWNGQEWSAFEDD